MADKKDKRFTFDSERDGADVPTLTSLLYRKNVVKSGSSAGDGRPASRVNSLKNDSSNGSDIVSLEPTMTIDTSVRGTKTENSLLSAPVMEIAPLTHARKTEGGLKVKPAAQPYQDTLGLPATVPSAYSPLSPAAPGIQYLFQTAKVASVVVFQPKANDLLESAALVGTSCARAKTWNTMEFAPKDFPEIWTRLEKFGFAEFTSLGVAGPANADRTAFRVAFDVKANECLTLLRIRQPSGGETLVAVLSGSSIQSHIPNFHSACMGEASARAA